MAKALPIELRERVIGKYTQGVTVEVVADQYQVGTASVKRWLRLLRETGSVAPLPHGGGNPARIGPTESPLVAELVKQTADATVIEVIHQYEERTGKSVSRSAMNRTIIRLGITRKKKTVRPSEQNQENVKQRREEYTEEMSDIRAERLIFIDETGSNLAMTRTYARSPKGERAVGTAPANGGKNVTIIGALGVVGLIATMTITGPADGDVFLEYVRTILVPKLEPGQIVVMDNVSTHKVSGIREVIESAGCELKYLPPYSPDLNPIEECWSKIKEILRSIGARTQKALDDAIAYAIRQVVPENCTGWFNHGGYRYQPN